MDRSIDLKLKDIFSKMCSFLQKCKASNYCKYIFSKMCPFFQKYKAFNYCNEEKNEINKGLFEVGLDEKAVINLWKMFENDLENITKKMDVIKNRIKDEKGFILSLGEQIDKLLFEKSSKFALSYSSKVFPNISNGIYQSVFKCNSVETFYQNVKDFHQDKSIKRVHFAMNSYFFEFLFKMLADKKKYDFILSFLVSTIENKILKDFSLYYLQEGCKNFFNESYPVKHLDFDLEYSIMKFRKHEDLCHLLKKFVNFECFARSKNLFVLYRGKECHKLKYGVSIDCPFNEKQNEYPFSISFGLNLFSGLCKDRDACPFLIINGNRCQENEDFGCGNPFHKKKRNYGDGYILLIDIKNYRKKTAGKRLFYIPPFSCLESLILIGEFFHARSMFFKSDAKLTDESFSQKEVCGVYSDEKYNNFGMPIGVRKSLLQSCLGEKEYKTSFYKNLSKNICFFNERFFDCTVSTADGKLIRSKKRKSEDGVPSNKKAKTEIKSS